MTRLILPLLALVMALPALAQSSTESAKADGKAFAREATKAAQQAASTSPDANRIPNFTGTPPQSGYFDDPDRMSREAASAATSNEAYRAVRDSMERRARFEPLDLDALVARSQTINEDPLAYTSGMSVTGTQGRCVPLPPGTSSPGTYRTTCNTGYELLPDPRSCTIPLTVSVESRATYRYYAEVPFHTGIAPAIDEFAGALASGNCTNLGSADTCQVVRDYGLAPSSQCANYRIDILECRAPVAVTGGIAYPATSERWFAQQGTNVVSTARDESACTAHDANAMCVGFVETCTDSSPVTRLVDGVPVTQPCWAWRRDYTCYRYKPANDCGALAARPECHVVAEHCITDETPCRTVERIFECPLPAEKEAVDQFICDGDVYCIDGSCETIEREANTEFKDAVVALHSLAQANREFDPDSLSLFKGERETCHSKVFGVINCCKGKGFPLIPGISLLVALGCDREEVLLHQRDAQGLCAYVGTYCSDSVLGVCVTKKKVYCCFESKLTRIIQEQGRQQLGKPWAAPRREQCLGFSVEEFSRLDLSKMDFSEVYAEFTEAARLPDELETATQIQQKIEDFYASSRR